MERNFTTECYEAFCSLVDRVNDKNWNGISDWFGDRFLDIKHLLQGWGWLERTHEIETYYKELLDRKNASKETVTQVFENISELDVSFAGNRTFGYCKQQLDVCRQGIAALAEITAGGHSNGKLSPSFTATAIQTVEKTLLDQLRIYALPLSALQFTASTFSELSNEEKEACVSRCEELFPDWAIKIDQALSDPDWTDQEKLDIKFMIYSSPEPYRSVYLKYLGQFDIVVFRRGSADSQGIINSSYSSLRNTVFLKDGHLTQKWDPDSPYNVLFHECGHAMDTLAGPELYPEEILSFAGVSNFHELDGKTLQERLVEDTRNYVKEWIDNQFPLLSEEYKEELLVSLNLSDDADFQYGGSTSELTPKSLITYRKVLQGAMFFELADQKHGNVSDIYGGVTNNAILGFNGHKKYPFVKSENFTYWYKDGSATNLQASELWAEFYAAQMTHDEEALAILKEHFPTAYPALEEMARQMAAQ